jgi:DNA-binding HxlR family transcriptional regulator
VALVSNKWRTFIVHDLVNGKKRFSQLYRDIEGISQKVLTDNLRIMEADGLITRTVYPEVPPRVEYELSELGESFCTVLVHLARWGRSYQQLIKDGKIKPIH